MSKDKQIYEGRIRAASKDINMGRIGAAHGIKGSLRIKSYTENPLDLGKYGPLHDEKNNTYTIKNIRPQKTMVIVRFKEITSREQAEPLNGTELFIAQSKLPENLESEEFYIKDLIGIDVLDQMDERVGTIIDVANFGAGDLLEISSQKEKDEDFQPTYYLAFTKSNVPVIDFEKQYIKIIPPIEIDARTFANTLEVNEEEIELEENEPFE